MCPIQPTERTPAHLNITAKMPAFPRRALALIGLLVTSVSALADSTLVPLGATWKYKDDGSNQGTAWRAAAFNDSTWVSGPAELGYGDGDEATVVNGGPATNHFVTTYFRTSFNVANPAAFTSLRIRLLRDDGAVVYLNGTEVRRDNMPGGTVSSTTLASTALGAPAESTFYETSIGTSSLVAGTNVIAVEVHQANATSTDVSFNLELTGVDTTSVTRGPYLQNGTTNSVIVRWRTDSATDSRVSFGTSPAALTTNVDDATVTTEHQIQLTGLTPNTQYYYSVGSTSASLASGSDYSFFTAPPVGTVQPTRIWVLGDSGTADAVAAGVRNGYTSFTGTRNTDVWLMLGDNAYNNGTDAEYEAAVFDMYPSYLRQTVLWPAIGNHDTAGSTNPSLTIPYFQMFTLPTAGEAGGVASGTEKYYSFDYANIHFICLDSMTSSRAPGSPMLTWLQSDLESTNQQWIVAFWHHPAYTKGSHNSDTETQLIEMRQNVLPILEAGGVDLVLAGHSHNYERSYFINGHYGLSTTFSGSHLIDGGDGRETGTGVYAKPAGLPANQGAVYVTAGNGGHVTNWVGGSTAEFNPNPHPAMYYSALHVGSMVLDVDGQRMDVKMIRETGAVDDFFTIVKNVPNVPPTVAITSPSEGATFTEPANIAITADATDSDGSVAQVDFYRGGTLIGSDTSAPFGVSWNNVATGTYALTAVATDNLGATVASAAVNITVQPAPPTPPAAPTSLTASGGNAAVSLSWTGSSGATSYTVKRGLDAAGPFSPIASGLTSTGYVDNTVSNGTTYYYVVSASNAGGESPDSNVASATPQAPPPPPAAPTSLTATGGNATVSLSWTGSSGATAYTVKRGLDAAGPFSPIASGLTSTGYVDNTVSNGTTYYYVVSASNAGGESPDSNVASATPQPPPPAAPTSLNASGGNATVSLSWTGSSGATAYTVKRGLDSAGPFSPIASGLTSTGYVDNTVSNGTTYYYVVSASNAGGESPDSNVASATPQAPPPVPNAPSALTANALSKSQVQLNWADNSGDESGFRIERATGTGAFVEIATVAANTTAFTDGGLKPNKTYSYRVRAYSAAGNSAYSNTATVTTPRR